jgi:hypothetical protein
MSDSAHWWRPAGRRRLIPIATAAKGSTTGHHRRGPDFWRRLGLGARLEPFLGCMVLNSRPPARPSVADDPGGTARSPCPGT